MIARIVLLTLLMTGYALAADSSSHYGSKAEGWFWYKDPKEKPKPAVPEPPKETQPPPKKPDEKPPEVKPAPFTTQWLKENYEKVKMAAIEHPDDKDKMAAYLYIQRMILDKSQNFATAAHQMANTDPLLDESNRIPLDTAAKFAVMRGFDRAKKDAIKEMASKGGLFFFFDTTCGHCLTQQQAIDWLVADYGFSIKNISVDGKGLPGMRSWVKDEGQAKALGLRIMPTTVFVVPPNGYFIISQGFHSAETLGEKILMVAQAQNLLPPDVTRQLGLFERGVLTPGDMRDKALMESAEEADDPSKWVKQLRDKLEGKY